MQIQSERYPRLDRRLQAIADLVNPEGRSGLRLADVGTDHGYLVSYLALTGQIAKGYACDINPQPLERARRTLECYGVQGVELRLSDGLAALSPEMVDRVVIAGMGGDMMVHILSQAGWQQAQQIEYRLQPNTKADHLRLWLVCNGYRILEEQVAQQGKFFYPILRVRSGKMEIPAPCFPLFCAAGLLAVQDKPLTAWEKGYLSRRKQALELRLQGLSASQEEHGSAAVEERRQLEDTLAQLCARLEGADRSRKDNML